jgi:glyoxylase-like metal-dependent hydrolase (beta-lactamase superfamily II)
MPSYLKTFFRLLSLPPRHRCQRAAVPALVGFVLICATSIPVNAQEGVPDVPPSVPEEATGPQVDPEKGYLVQEIRDGLYWATDGAYQIMFLDTGEGVVVVDAPPSFSDKIPHAIASVTDQPITHVIYSHVHGDHIGGAGIYPEEATVIAHEETHRLLRRDTPCTDCTAERPLPDITFSDRYAVEVGGERLELSYHGPDHAPGNIYIHAPRQKTVMHVDVVYPGWVPFDLLSISKDIPGFISAHDQILAYDFETFVGGHLTRLGNREDVRAARAYIRDVEEAARAALKSHPRPPFIAELGREVGFENKWHLVEAHAEAVVEACAEAVSNEWKGRLGGVATYTASNCRAMQYSRRID